MNENKIDKQIVIDYEGAWKELERMLGEQLRLANLMLLGTEKQINNPLLNMMGNILAEFTKEEPVQ